jgi:hypothetical protein
MKTKFTLLAIGSALIFHAIPVQAQIGEGESSINAIAMQCSVSSGFSTSGFEDYSRRLAKTLALLSPAQQKRVFGYLPKPGATMEVDGGNLSVSPGQLMAAEETGETGSDTLDGLVALVGGINETLSGASAAKSSPVYLGVMINAPEASTTASASTDPAALTNSASNVAPVESAPSGENGQLLASADATVPTASALTAPTPLASTPSNVAPVESAPSGEAGQLLASADANTLSSSQQKKSYWGEALAWVKEAETAYEEGNLREFLKGEAE